ncbi:ureidoglycolate dehydrogenase (NAD+) [Alkalihalobacillus xiaoxiensis]|uniref:Ureidoglycolate dehydrogenase (NAD+) n=1 Tax=Shouchella xiaoxiensis TaxID=766895 RepID=A0ABS2SYE4_9BACI|nr:ureidoglycolate dehydrogenase [Shouchella xiaoxiensis]MBM7839454.1 ureidoglycolate dehydrogenase (NAD+) [Shouchella xiaoxiensis]
MPHLSTEELIALTLQQFTQAGVDQATAEAVTDVLIHANLRGVDSHGVLRVEHYLTRIKAGGINLTPNPKLTKTSCSTLLYDGDNGFGQAISKQAMAAAITQASESGMSAVAVKNSSHCGALSYFVQQAAEAKMIGIAMSHTDKIVVPFGGAEPFFGTNPIAFGFPTDKEDPVILDLATSTVALGKILNAKENEQPIPHGWGVDSSGQSTTNPENVAALTPFGGPKGYGLAMVVEIFSALLTGAAFGPHVSKMYGDYEQNRELGHFYMAIDPAVFTGLNSFATRLDQMIAEIRQTPAAEGVDQVLVPGEIENQIARKRKEEGIPIPESVYRFLVGES